MKGNNPAQLLGLLTLVTTLSSAAAADITGTITVKGTPPPEKEIEVKESVKTDFQIEVK